MCRIARSVHPEAMTTDLLKLSFGLLIGGKGRNRPRIAQKLVPNLEINRYVTFL